MSEVTSSRTIVLVGHCFPDRFMLKTAIKRAVKGGAIETVNNQDALEAHLHPEAVLLVNRELDGKFGTSNGIELIENIAGRDDAPIMLLISNYEEAQAQAVEAGARPGFGKGDLYHARTAELLLDAAVP